MARFALPPGGFTSVPASQPVSPAPPWVPLVRLSLPGFPFPFLPSPFLFGVIWQDPD
jgi:hypothetical protein